MKYNIPITIRNFFNHDQPGAQVFCHSCEILDGEKVESNRKGEQVNKDIKDQRKSKPDEDNLVDLLKFKK